MGLKWLGQQLVMTRLMGKRLVKSNMVMFQLVMEPKSTSLGLMVSLSIRMLMEQLELLGR
jgi:hypothetical protein